jgi:tetratricopeptide (TPR) repeat protein
MAVMKAVSMLLACSICIASAQRVAKPDVDISRVLDLLLKSEIAKAKSLLLAITGKFPGDPRGWSLLGKVLVKEARYGDAEDALVRSLYLRPGTVTTLTELANARVGLGEFDAAKVGFEQAVQLNDRRKQPLAEPYASYAIFLLRTNDVAAAERYLVKAKAVSPANELVIEAQRGVEVRSKLKGRPDAARLIPPVGPVKLSFAEIGARAGLRVRLENSPTAEKHQIETMPGGVAAFDYNNDGFMDIFFTNGASIPSLRKTDPKQCNRLFRNNGDLTFTDVTEAAGVCGNGYDMGVAAADYDNDGNVDLFIAGVNQNTLLHNNGDGTFTNLTEPAGLNSVHPQFGKMWSIHAVWADFDNDGWLDLFVVAYCKWDPVTEPWCGDAATNTRTYCHPSKYAALPNRLYRNNRNGTFTDVSKDAGIDQHHGKGMGAAAADFDGDGLIDIFVANDAEPNFLFHNLGKWKFGETGMAAGVALNEFGKAVSSMGADFRDMDNDGRPDLFVTDLSNEGFLLFRNGTGGFEDVSDASGIATASLPWSGWSNAIADFNNDGWKDLFSANGHAIDNIERLQSRSYRQSNVVLMNGGQGKFAGGSPLGTPAGHRGAAVADFDNDGREDLVVTALGETPRLFHNETNPIGNWLLIALTGTKSNRGGLGAIVQVRTSEGAVLTNQAIAATGYGSSSDPRVHFGLGSSTKVKEITVIWPTGTRQVLKDVDANQILRITEPR